MIIDKTNATISSKDIYIHDDVVEELTFVRSEYKLTLLLSTHSANRQYTIEFSDVIGFEMSSCDFWGSSSRIYDFVVLECKEYSVIPRLKQNQHFDSVIEPTEVNDYIEVKIIFISGDELAVACKRIEYNK